MTMVIFSCWFTVINKFQLKNYLFNNSAYPDFDMLMG